VPLVASYRLVCDGVECGRIDMLGELTKSQATSETMKRGWQTMKGGSMLCPTCIKKRNPVKTE